MGIYTIAGFVIAAVFLSLAVKSYRPEYSVFIGLIVTVLIVVSVLPDISRLFNFISDTMARSGTAAQWMQPMLKGLGIGIVTEIAADTCRDAGENSMASRVELAGKVAIMIVALPLAEGVLSLVSQLVNG
ncbi:MAG: SpoIIIAC/SpoIIIAD family protein [Bacillota bacterium]|nr:SpoIIIAC/SpoIIIAD family protein [Bacillota bacterium]